MKKPQLIFLIVIISVFVIPKVVLAVWWNPFSWSWFKSKKTEVVTLSEKVDQKNSISNMTEKEVIPIELVTFDNKVIRSVLHLKIYDTFTKKDISWGTGISIGGLGNILTNYHVVSDVINNPTRYQVYGCVTISINTPCNNFNYLLGVKSKLPNNNFAYDGNLDLAVIYIDKVYFNNAWISVLETSLNTLKDRTINISSYVKNINDLSIDESVYSIGYPDYGGGKAIQTQGVVKDLFTDPETGQKLILNSTNISHGNSGGPVFNSKGELVGVTVACLTVSPYSEKCKLNSGLFIPLPVVNWWYSKVTNSKIITWEGKQSYLQQSDLSWQNVLCSLRQNAYYNENVSVDSCTCKNGFSKNTTGDCVNNSGFVDPSLRYGKAPDPEAEQKALQILMDAFENLPNSSNTPIPSSDSQINDLECVKKFGPNRVWDGNMKRISCTCKEDTLWFRNESMPNPHKPGHYYVGLCIDPKTITKPFTCGGVSCSYND